ncbi:hypothetical protein ABT144_18525 [Streptomyces sp. NPDC002039]
MLYFAMPGLIVDDLTVPSPLDPYPVDDLPEAMVKRLLPARPTD